MARSSRRSPGARCLTPTADSRIRTRACALLLVAFGWAGRPVSAQAPGDEVALAECDARLEWAGPLCDSHRALAAILRAARVQPAPGAGLIERLVAPGPESIAPLLDILVQQRIPRAQPEDAPQLLSAPQRELLLAALARLPAAGVRTELLRRLEPSAAKPDPALQLAALRVFELIGTRADFPGLAALAPRAEGEIPPAPEGALRAAYVAILRREPVLLARGSTLLRARDVPATRQLLFALGDLGDKRALPLLDDCVRTSPEHAQQAVGLVARIGASGDPDFDQPLSDWLAERLDPERTEWTRTSLRAIGVLDDGRQVPALLEQLESPHPGLRAAALGALRQVSGLKLGDAAEAWREWHAAESAWLETGRPAAQHALESRKDALVAQALRAYSERCLFRDQLAEDVLPVLDHGTPAMRVMACETLARLRSKRALEPLVGLFSDEHEALAEAAWRAACELTGQSLARNSVTACQQLALR